MLRANTDLTDESDMVAQSADDFDEEMSEVSDLESTSPEKRAARRSRLAAMRKKVRKPFEFAQNKEDVLGIVFMEVVAAKDLPPERNGLLKSFQG
jgi:hypothetical protein